MNINQINNEGYTVTASTNTFFIQKIDLYAKLVVLQNRLVIGSQSMANLSIISINKNSDPLIQVVQ